VQVEPGRAAEALRLIQFSMEGQHVEAAVAPYGDVAAATIVRLELRRNDYGIGPLCRSR
jgi:hypothetical protein